MAGHQPGAEGELAGVQRERAEYDDERASVWDHCHTHGFVRAPLCNRCNTRNWRGWRPQHGRATHSRNFDGSYYGWCPKHAGSVRQCSA